MKLVVAAGVVALSVLSGGVFGTPDVAPWDVEIVEVPSIGAFDPGEHRTVSVTVANRGSEAWDPDQGFAFAAHWVGLDGEVVDWDGPRTAFPGVVEPGAVVHLEAVVRAPLGIGPSTVVFDVVQEGVRWLSQEDPTPPAPVVVVVSRDRSDAPCGWCWAALGWAVLVVASTVVLKNRPGPAGRIGGSADLLWFVGVAISAERAVVGGSWWGGVVSLVLLGALAGFIHVFRRPVRRWVTAAVGASLTLLWTGERVYVRFFSDLPSIGTLRLAGQGDEVGRSILSLLEPGDVALVASGLAGILIAVLSRRFRMAESPMKARLAVAVVTTLAAASSLVWAAHRPVHRQVFRRIFVAQDIGPAATHTLDIAHAIRNRWRHTVLSDEAFDRIAHWFQSTRGDRAGTGPWFGAARGCNVVMIQAESVQAFVVGLDIGGETVMPNLTRWAAEGLRFTEVTDQTGHGRSSDAELTTQVSLLPLADGAAAFEAAGNHVVGLATALAETGYHTVSAVPFDPSFWNRGVNHRAYGYEERLFARDFRPARRIGWGLNDRDFLSQMADRLTLARRPFCAWLLTLSLHHPFEGFPDDLQELDVGRWEGSPVGEYLHTMRYLDRALGDLEGRLSEAGLADDTVLVLWGDHDAGFEWTPEVAALMGQPPDSAGWYRSQRVPLIIKAPDRFDLEGRIEIPAGHVDVAPTVAALLGIDPGDLPWMGRNLLGRPGDEPVVGEYDCWTDNADVFLQGDSGTLESGRCLSRSSLMPRPISECADAFERARERVAIAQDVLEHDLQARLRQRLGGDGS